MDRAEAYRVLLRDLGREDLRRRRLRKRRALPALLRLIDAWCAAQRN